MISKLIVIAGSGSYPRLAVEGARKAGVAKVDVLAVKGSTDRATVKAADEVVWFGLGDVLAGITWVAGHGYDGAMLAGSINPLSLFRTRFDETARGWLASMKVKSAHSIYGKLIAEYGRRGVNMLPASCFMDDHLPGVGALTRRGLTPDEEADVRRGMQVAHDVGAHDVGQTVMVKAGMVLAVEAFEGTNAAIRRGGKLGGRGGVIFKAARDGHDMRFDIPVIGLKTLEVAHRAGATAIAFQAERLILLDREAVLAYANRHDIAIVGMPTDLPAAPLRP